MAGAKRTRREDGAEYASPIIGTGTCAYCGNDLVQRAEGRPALYCSPSCRSGAYRRSRPQWQTRRGEARGQTN